MACICIFPAWVQLVQVAYGLVKPNTSPYDKEPDTELVTFLSDGLFQGLYTFCRVHFVYIFAKFQDPRGYVRKGHPHCF